MSASMDIVVLDDSSLWALLRLAYRDGLISLPPGVHLQQLTAAADPALELQVLQQLVVTPHAIGLFDRGSLAENMLQGEFLESEYLSQASTPTQLDQVTALPLEFIAGVLRARGYLIAESDYLPRLEAAMAIHEERDRRVASGERFPELEDIIQKVLGTNEHTKEEWEFYERFQHTEESARPLVSAFKHAQEVMTAAARHSAHGMFPYQSAAVHPVLKNPQYDASASDNDKKLALIQVVARDLGTLLPPPSLKETLKLASSPEAVALRHKSSEWITQLRSGNANSLASIRSEINRAMRSLERAKRAKSVGSFLTWTTVPVAIAEMVVGSPGIAGMTIGVVSTVTEASIRATEMRYRWAMFGQR